jgi:hypothetical protein
VKQLEAMKAAHEAEPDIFGPSQVNLGTDDSLEPCAAPRASCDATRPNATGWPLCCHS